MKFKLSILLLVATLVATACNRYEVGDYYRKGDVSGLVLTLDEEGQPVLIVSLDEARDLDADSAKVWCAAYADGSWRLPDKREMQLIYKYRSLLNATLQRREQPQMMGSNTYYWTATDCSESHVYACGPLGVKCYFRTNHSPLYRVRAVRTIEK